MRKQSFTIADRRTAARVLRSRELRVDHPFRSTRRVFGATVLDVEGAEHARKRSAWARQLARRALEADFLPLVDRAVEEAFANAEAFGGLHRTCEYIPHRVALAAVGRPDLDPFEHAERLRPIVAFLESSTPPADLAASRAYLADVARGCRSTLLDAFEGREREREIGLFLVAASETTVAAMADMLLSWKRSPAAFRRLATPQDIDALIAERLAEELPFGLATRYCAADTLVGGCPMTRGDIVHIDLQQAQLDARGDPDEGPADFVFGIGRHRCPGSGLALMELHRFVARLRSCDPEDYALHEDAPAGERGKTFRRPPAFRLVRRAANARRA